MNTMYEPLGMARCVDVEVALVCLVLLLFFLFFLPVCFVVGRKCCGSFFDFWFGVVLCCFVGEKVCVVNTDATNNIK